MCSRYYLACTPSYSDGSNPSGHDVLHALAMVGICTSSDVASCHGDTRRVGASGPSQSCRMQTKQVEAYNDMDDHCRGRRLALVKVNRAIARLVPTCNQSLPRTNLILRVCGRWYEQRWHGDVFVDLDSSRLMDMNFRVALG